MATTQELMDQMELDFESLAEEHDAAAENERIWALGAKDADQCQMHTENMKQHRLLARMYRRMKGDTLAFVESYEDYE